MGRKEIAPFDNPWLSAIDSTEKKLTRYASFNPLHPVSETSCSVLLEHRSPDQRREITSSCANDCLPSGNQQAEEGRRLAAPAEEAYHHLLPTLTRINQRRRAANGLPPQRGGQDESVEVALRVVRKQRAVRLKQ